MSDSGSPISICVKINSSKGEKSVVVKSASFFIGRGHDCTIRIDNSGISRTHVEISFEDGILYVADQGSSNGTFLNGTKLTGFQRVSTNPTDKIALGRSDIILNAWVEQKVNLHAQATRTVQQTTPPIPIIPPVPVEPKIPEAAPFFPPPVPAELAAAVEAEAQEFEFKISRDNEPSIQKVPAPIKIEQPPKIDAQPVRLRTSDSEKDVGESVVKSLESNDLLRKAQEVLDGAIEQQSDILLKAQVRAKEIEDNASAAQKHAMAAAQQQSQTILEEAKRQKAQMMTDIRAKELQILEEAKKKEAKIIEEARGKEAVLHEEFRKREALMMEDLKKKEVQFIANAKQKEADLLTRAQKKADEIILHAQRKASDIEEATQGQLLEMKAHAETQARERMDQARTEIEKLNTKVQKEIEALKAKAAKEADQIRIKSENDADDLLERTKQEAIQQAEEELKTAAAHLREQKATLEGEVKVMSGTAEKLRAETMQMTKEVRALNQEKQALTSELTIIKRDVEGLSSQRNEAFEEMHKREMFKAELEMTVAELLQKKEAVNDELSNVRQRLTVETGKLDSRRKEFTDYETQTKETMARYKADLEDLATKKEETDNRLKAATATVLNLEKKRTILTEEIAKHDKAHEDRMAAQNAAYEELSRKQDASYAEQVRKQNLAHEKLIKEQTGHLAEEAQRLESKIRVLTANYEEQVRKQTATFDETLAKQNAIHRELIETQNREYAELCRRNKEATEKDKREHEELVKKQQSSFEKMVQDQQNRFAEQLTAEQEKNEDQVQIHQSQIAQLQRLERTLTAEIEALKKRKEQIGSEVKEVEVKGASTKSELSAVSEDHQKQMKALEKELKDARQAAASELALIKTQYEEKMQRMSQDEAEKLNTLRTQVARDLMKQQDNLANEIHQKLWTTIAKDVSPEVYQSKGPETLDFIRRAISNRITGGGGEDIAPMEFAQSIQRRANQAQWKIFLMGFVGAAVLMYGYHHFFMADEGSAEMASQPNTNRQPEQPAAEKKPVAQEPAPQEERPIKRFHPMQDNELRDSYTESVLYTKNYEKTFLDSDIQDRWMKDAVEHISKRLKIEEAKTVEAISISRTLVTTLQKMKQEIHADYVHQSVAKMHELETNSVDRMTALFGAKNRYDIFKKYEKRFFATELSGHSKKPDRTRPTATKNQEFDELFE